jgi:hypothetical protein
VALDEVAEERRRLVPRIGRDVLGHRLAPFLIGRPP